METGDIGIKTLLASVTVIAAVETVAWVLHKDVLVNTLVVTGAARLLETALILFIIMKRKNSLICIGLDTKRLLSGCLTGLKWSAVFGAAAAAVFCVLLPFGINPVDLITTGIPCGAGKIVLLCFVGCLIGPMAEEIFFRGIIYGFFRKWGIVLAVALSTIFFAAGHSVGASIPVVQLIGGIVFALAYEKANSLMAPFIIHMLGNTAIFTISIICRCHMFG